MSPFAFLIALVMEIGWMLKLMNVANVAVVSVHLFKTRGGQDREIEGKNEKTGNFKKKIRDFYNVKKREFRVQKPGTPVPSYPILNWNSVRK